MYRTLQLALGWLQPPHTSRFRVAEATLKPIRGGPTTLKTQTKKKKKNVFVDPWGWLDHLIATWGGPATPKANGGGLATLKSQI